MSERAIYDNPETGQRECYVDGSCQWFLTAHAIMMGNLPGEARNLGAFTPGRVSGDAASLPEHLRQPRRL